MNQHEELVARDVKKFTYCELRCATRDFGNERFLGKGSFGNVYKGWVDRMTYFPHNHNDGLPVAVKKLSDYKLFHLKMLKEFSHPNLVKLIGYCLEGEQLLLVYEYMNNRSFEDLLRSGVVARLPLATKVKMVVGIARGIVFLQKTQSHEICVEVKPHIWTGPVSDSRLDRNKILLNEDFTAKLSDYDVTKLVQGHYIRVDDDDFGYYYPGFKPFQLRTNISGFIMVFAEVITGKRILNENELWKINRFFRKSGQEPLDVIAQICFKECNARNSESKMLKRLKEYDELIRKRRESLMLDTSD